MEHLKLQTPPNPSLCRCSINQSSGFNRFLRRIRSLSSSNGTLRCQECEKKEMGKSFKKTKNVIFGAEFLWVCLDCERIFCGDESLGQPDGHIRYHAINNHHPAAIQIAAWCFECKSIHRITTREVDKASDSAIEVKEDPRGMEQGDFKDLPAGYVVRPMHNFGNSCFFNAVLQNLLSMDVLQANFADSYCQGHSIAQDLWNLFLDTSDFTDGNVVMVGHADLLASICSRVPNFWGYQQQDSHELLRYLLSELLADGTGFIEDIFGGRFSSTISCVQCGNDSKSYEPFLDLSLAIPSNECSTKKDEVVTSMDLVIPAIEISSCPSKGNEIYSSMDATPIGLWAPESLDLSSQLLTVRAANWSTKLHGFSRKKMSAKVDKVDPNESSTISDTKVSIGEDVKNAAALKKRISPYMIPNLDLESRICRGEQSVDCCGQQPCACSEDLIKVAESLESQRKDQIVEVEEVPEDCCGQNPCVCNKDLGGVAELVDSLLKDLTKGGEEVEEDPKAEVRYLIVEVDNLIAELKVPVAEVVNPIAKVEDLTSCYGQKSFICNIDSSEVAKFPGGQKALFTDKEDSVELQDAPKVENFPAERSTEQNDNLESDDKYRSIQLDVFSRKRSRCASSLKFEDEIQSGDRLSIEKCLDLLTAPEILSGEYACDHCSNHSRDHTQTEPQSTGKHEKLMEGNQLGGHGVTDEVKPEVENKDEGVHIGSRKAKMDVSKRYLIFKAPCILTIHLKRFTQDTNGISKKINIHVNIQEILDLTPYMDPSCEDKENSCYRLIGVVQHLGVDLMGGHYVAYIRGVRSQGNELAWFRASDLDVREASLNEVLNSDAYILFYERM